MDDPVFGDLNFDISKPEPDEPDFSWSEVGMRIRAWRVARRMRQVDLAEAAKLTQPAIHAIESGTSNPQLSSLERIAAVFGKSVRELIAGTPPQPGSKCDRAVRKVCQVFESENSLAIRLVLQGIEAALGVIEAHDNIRYAFSRERAPVFYTDGTLPPTKPKQPSRKARRRRGATNATKRPRD